MEHVEKAKWDAKFINNLPDAAFAYILPGGKKDKEGKTVPRGLRLLPHHNMNVKSPTENTTVDKPHLRNGLARVNQIKAPDDVKAKAKAHLMKHAKELLPSQGGGKKPTKKHEEIMESRKNIETQVSVEKSQLPLKDGETLRDFLKSMGMSVMEHLKNKVSIGKDADVYPVDIYGDKVIVDLYVGSEPNLVAEGESRVKYYQMSYVRNVNGEFEFGDPVEMEKRIVFIPKGEPVQKSFWSGVL